MRILIFGGAGMLGHKLWTLLRADHDAWATFRERRTSDLPRPLCDEASSRFVFDVTASDVTSIEECFRRLRPDVVVNAIGIVKQRETVKAVIPAIEVNSLFPHRLAECCAAAGARLIHISTDCVFSGRRGGYTENDEPDPVDTYGRTKLLGEVHSSGCLTIRTSLVGWELRNFSGLFEWFVAQRGKRVQGYRLARFSGLVTTFVADLLAHVVLPNDRLVGVRHVASAPIAKYELLTRLRDSTGWRDITIEADTTIACDRCLDGSLFEAETGWSAPSWDTMVDRAANEWRQYMEWRKR